MPDKDLGSKKLSPVTFYYFNLTGTESFCAQLFSRLELKINGYADLLL